MLCMAVWQVDLKFDFQNFECNIYNIYTSLVMSKYCTAVGYMCRYMPHVYMNVHLVWARTAIYVLYIQHACAICV